LSIRREFHLVFDDNVDDDGSIEDNDDDDNEDSDDFRNGKHNGETLL
jgi:hypothetical protein